MYRVRPGQNDKENVDRLLFVDLKRKKKEKKINNIWLWAAVYVWLKILPVVTPRKSQTHTEIHCLVENKESTVDWTIIRRLAASEKDKRQTGGDKKNSKQKKI